MEKKNLIFRSMLYVPGNVEKMIRKIPYLNSDCYVVDLEDSVPHEEKENARAIIAKCNPLLPTRNGRTIITRVNPVTSEELAKDIKVAVKYTDGVLLPKVGTLEDVLRPYEMIRAMAGDSKKLLFCMIETAKSLLNLKEICASGKVSGLVLGSYDLARELGLSFELESSAINQTRFMASLGAASENIVAIDGVYANYRDSAGFEEECRVARGFGLAGKSLIHPSQIEIANRIFSPSIEEVKYAERVIKAMNEAIKNGRASASLDGNMIDFVHLRQAEKIIERTNLIQKISRTAN